MHGKVLHTPKQLLACIMIYRLPAYYYNYFINVFIIIIIIIVIIILIIILSSTFYVMRHQSLHAL